MTWTTLCFGKYKGKTFPEIMFSDPDYFFWGYEDGRFQGWLIDEARDIYKKACAIQLPPSLRGKKLVEYVIHRPSGTFGMIRLVNPHNSLTDKLEVIDMSYPRLFKRCDRVGYKNLLVGIKCIVFGSPKRRMTKKRCEDFFDNDDNFLI